MGWTGWTEVKYDFVCVCAGYWVAVDIWGQGIFFTFVAETFYFVEGAEPPHMHYRSQRKREETRGGIGNRTSTRRGETACLLHILCCEYEYVVKGLM